jgi:HEPN domain
LKKASQDKITLDALLGEPKVGDEVFGFHCQQAVEKLLKAVLAAKGVAFRRTHDLEALFGLLENAGAPFPDELQDSRLFTGFAVTAATDARPLQRDAPHARRHFSLDDGGELRKGQDSQENQTKREFLDEWVRAVNEQGGFGRWSWAVSRTPSDLPEILESVART